MFCGVERPHGSKPLLPTMPSRWAGDSFQGRARDLAIIWMPELAPVARPAYPREEE
jgi:hypothetical protein